MTAVAAAGDRVFAVAPDPGTLLVLEASARDGGFTDRGCFAAVATPGCTTVPALTGASDVVASLRGGRVYVTARDSDAVLAFAPNGSSLAFDGCAAAALAGCTPAPALDAPRALALGPIDGRVWVVSSDSVAAFSPELAPQGCIEQGPGTPGGCAGGRALADPRDVAVAGETAVVAGDAGVALLRGSGEVGCVTEGGAEGCTAGAGVADAASVVAHGYTAYVGAPGPGTLTTLLVPPDAAPKRVASQPAPAAALATPPEHFIADGPSYAGSHVYGGGAGIRWFARDLFSGALTAMGTTTPQPSGAVAGLAVSGDFDSTAVYAAIPSAGAVVAFARNIRPLCTSGLFGLPLPPVPATAELTTVPTSCYDANGDALAYSVATPPTRGDVIGFQGDAAIYRRPPFSTGGVEAFTVRASDGAESALSRLKVALPPSPPIVEPFDCSVRILTRSARLDRRGRISVRVRASGFVRCRVTLRLRRGRARVLRRVTIDDDRAVRLRVRLPARVRRDVRRARRRGVLVRATLTHGTSRHTRRIRVRPRRAP